MHVALCLEGAQVISGTAFASLPLDRKYAGSRESMRIDDGFCKGKARITNSINTFVTVW